MAEQTPSTTSNSQAADALVSAAPKDYDLNSGLAGLMQPNAPAVNNPPAGPAPDINAPKLNANPSQMAAPTADLSGGPRPGSWQAKLSQALADNTSSPLFMGVVKQFGAGPALMIAANTAHATAVKPGVEAGRAAGNIVDRFFAPMAGASGAIGGAGSVAKASQEQERQREIQEREKTAEQRRQEREDLQDRIAVSTANAQMLHSQATLHLLGNKAVDESIADGIKDVAQLKNAEKPGETIGTDLTSDDIERGINEKGPDGKPKYDTSRMTAFPTGKKVAYTGSDGIPVYRATYTVMTLPPEQRITDPLLAKELFPGKELGTIDEDHPLVVSGTIYNAAAQARDTRKANTLAAQQAADQAAEAAGQHAQKIEKMDFAGSDVWTKAIASGMRESARRNNGTPNLSEAHLLAFASLYTPENAAAIKKYPNLPQDVESAIGEKNFAAMELEQQKAADKRKEEAEKAAAKKEETKQQELVDAIGVGKLVPDRLGYLLARNPQLLNDIVKQYPNIDTSKLKAYPEVYTQFTSTKPGTAGAALNAGGTALLHLWELEQLNTLDSRRPGSAAKQAYDNKLDTVVAELAQFYKVPQTDKSIEAIRSTLGAVFNREAAIRTQSQSMADKFGSFSEQWHNAAPSEAYEAPMPNISNDAKRSLAHFAPDFVRDHPDFTITEKTQRGQPTVQTPSTQTHVFDSKAWAAANPGKDVNAAIAQAQKQGYEVK